MNMAISTYSNDDQGRIYQYCKFQAPRPCHAKYIKGSIKMHLYFKFEREIFKIVKVMAVVIVFFNAHASRSPTCMHVLSCKYDGSIL